MENLNSQSPSEKVEHAESQQVVTTIQIFVAFLRLGLTAFGGPAMIPFIKKMSVEKRKWLRGVTFKEGVVLSQFIPGTTAMQVAAYVGLQVKGVPGALASYIGFGLPAFLLMLFLSAVYASYNDVSGVLDIFNGLQILICAIVIHATWFFGKGTFKHYEDVVLAAIAALLFWVGASPFLIIAGAAIVGLLNRRVVENLEEPSLSQRPQKTFIKHLFLLVMALVVGLFVLFFFKKELFDIALFMMRIDLFAFGGGFGSVPLMLHEVVDVQGWMDSKTFMDGIILGQITPGPIVITSTFVGFLTNGIPGAVVATMAIFAPSILLVIVLSPLVARLRASVPFPKATRGILASFVGLLLYVSCKFSFAVDWNILKVILGITAFIALLKKIDLIYIVLATAFVSVVLF